MAHTEQDIVQGLANYDPFITKNYFYGYCQKAYNVCDYKYQLRSKTGLDFYSLAHDYYIHLLRYEFRPLLDKPADVKLSTWMMRGFHFVVLDALKAYNKEFEHQQTEVSDTVLEYLRAPQEADHFLMALSREIDAHYHDNVMSRIAHLVFVMGYKQKEVAEILNITPSAVNQRYKKMMEEVVTPFVMEHYEDATPASEAAMAHHAHVDFDADGSLPFIHSICNRCCIPSPERVTPSQVDRRQENQVCVFSSNLLGLHVGPTAQTALTLFGAQMHCGEGIQGNAYAIPTMQGGVEAIRPYVDRFIAYAQSHPEKQFLVTPIGCELSGFDAWDVAPLFSKATNMPNVYLPMDFWDQLT